MILTGFFLLRNLLNFLNLANRIKKNEGFRCSAYKDQLGKQTIGYGHLIKETEKHLLQGKISQEKLNKIFESDLRNSIKDFKTNYKHKHLSNRTKEVIIEMIFQLGIKNVLQFKKFNKHIQSGKSYLAAMEMINSQWFAQTPRRVEMLIAILIYKN